MTAQTMKQYQHIAAQQAYKSHGERYADNNQEERTIMSDITTVVPLPKRDKGQLFGPLRAKLNRGLIVHWINADLFTRAGHDIRKSIIFYDADGDFVTALLPEQWSAINTVREEFLAAMFRETPIRFWSKGLK